MQKEKQLNHAKQFQWTCSGTIELIFTQLSHVKKINNTSLVVSCLQADANRQ